jgi:hypothetical protein
MEMPVINIENFKQWLESKPSDETIGIKASCGKCPIAQYLNENFPLTDYNWWLVNGTQYSCIQAKSDRLIWMLPEWAKEFVSQIDNLRTGSNIVVREDCLLVLSIVAAM